MRKFYKNLLLGGALFAGALSAQAQVSVTATAGTTGPTAYTTLKSAFDAINAGTHSGAITVSISGNTTETATARLNGSVAPTSYTSVTIVPTAAATVSGSVSGPLVDLNGADNVVIEGRVGATGSARSLTFQNNSNTTGTSTIRMINDAKNNTLNFLTINGSSILGAGVAGTVLIDSSTVATGNTNITISNNDIGAAAGGTPSVAIYSIGESATLGNDGVAIRNNLIHDFFAPSGLSSGVLTDLFSTNFTITGNSFYQTATRTSTASATHIPLYVAYGNGNTISGNFIGGSAANAGGTAYTIAGAFSNYVSGMYFNVGPTNGAAVDGNTITNLNITSTPAANTYAFTGIRVVGGQVTIGTNAGNTIGAATGTGAITVNLQGSGAGFVEGIVTGAAGTGSIDIRNNTLGSITLAGSSTAANQLRGIETGSHSAVSVRNNTVGGSTAGSIQSNVASGTFIGLIAFQSNNGLTYTYSGNLVRNIVNNGTGTGNANITGIHLQVTTSSTTITNNISGNQIYNLSSPATTGTAGPINGIVVTQSGSLTGVVSEGVISNNQIYNFSSGSTGTGTTVRGISNSNTYNTLLAIDSNSIYQFSAAAANTASTSTTAVQGIVSSTSGAGLLRINGNSIYNMESTGASVFVSGIGAFFGGTTSSISANKIYDLRAPNAGTAGMVAGLILRGSGSVGTFNVTNNMISLSPASAVTIGIHNNATATQINAFHNTVYIGGTATGTNLSAAFARNGAAVTTAVDLRNNIFYNVRTGNSSNYALYNNATTPGTGWTTSDYNNLYTSVAASLAYYGSTAYDFAGYKTASGKEANSKNVAVTFVDPSTGDLHLSGASATDPNLKAVPVSGVTTDFDGETRSTTTPSMGADEPPCTAPTITTQPTAQAVCPGVATSFTVATNGTAPISFQWRKGGTNISGATGATLTISNPSAADAANYDVVITNSCGTVTANAVALTVRAATAVTAQPVAQTVCAGQSASFAVTATGENLTYAWTKDNNPIAGANSPTYTIASTTASDAGTYRVVVSGTCGSSITTTGATLTVNAAGTGTCTGTAVSNVSEEVSASMLLPNIVHNSTTLRLTARRAMNIDWSITDAQGRVVKRFSQSVNAGRNDLQLSVPGLSAGTYQVTGYPARGNKITLRFVKL
ncbi:hypothetical protein EPD60_13920 [Flaviaesturariibacter flavus]|uniref:Ig-like domain-containing protein n=1 Tax=Flaviaesturariibacter flavus TaxID=2502780 RepID=A0A4R1B955_9BACT|nr:immunoglobulin domain-containing protein [Flaviaesturariibacter flavus]TCJ13159.1 hypothetical protein EPD60_13920 [Flaviaesturariibacter flavus]